VLVFDDGAVHERAEVAQRPLVQLGCRDPFGDRAGERGGDLVHVGQPAGEGYRDLLAAGSLGDA